MKILQVIPYFIPAWQYGGPIPVVYELSKKLNEKGHQVTIATTTANGGEEIDISRTSVAELENLDVRYFKRVKLERAFSFLQYLASNSGYFYSPTLKKYLKKNVIEYDIVHLHEFYSYPSIIASRITSRENVRYVVHLHGMLSQNSMSRHKLKKQIYFNLFGKKLFSRADGMIAFTESEQKDAEKFAFDVQTAIIPNGINPRPIKKNTNENLQDYFGFGNRKVILYLGRLHPIKGIDLLISAFANLTAIQNDTILAIVGPDEIGYKKDLVALVSELNVKNRVVFIDLVSGEKKDYLFKRANVFSLTSYSEGFSISILEALAAGKPVVITEGCHFPDVEKYQAGFVASGDPEIIAQKLDCLLSDNSLCQKMSNNAVKLVKEKYTWDHIADKTIHFYNEILNKTS